MRRERERQALKNKIMTPNLVLKGGKVNYFKASSFESDALKSCQAEIDEGLQNLSKILYTTTGNEDFPVAFASNALYILERNNAGLRDSYESALLSTLRRKGEYLHA